MIYDIGDKVTLSTIVKTEAGTPVNTPALTIAVTKPDGTAVSPAPTVTNTGSGGLYTAQVTVDQAELWRYVWTASGTVVAVEPGQFTVRTQNVYVASMEEFKAHLNRSDATDDVELRTYLASATEWVEAELGGPLSVTTYTEMHTPRGLIITPFKTQLVSVTSITPISPVGASAFDSSLYYADTTLGLIVAYRYWPAPGPYTVAYRAGLSSIRERHKLAGLIVAAHLWDVQNGFAGRRNTTEFAPTGLGFAVPNRARELLAPDRMPAIG